MNTSQGYDPEDLSAYLDGELDSPQKEALEARLQVDPRCRAELEALKRVRGLFETWKPVRPRPFFVARFQERLRSEAAGSKGWKLQRFAAAAMVLLAVGSLAFAVYLNSPAVDPPTLESLLTRSMDQEVLELTTLQESDLSKDRMLDIVLTGNIR